MASIPLPALSVRTPEQPDILQRYSQLQLLKQQQQQSAEQSAQAPLRLQQLQQGVQKGGIELQQAQQALKNQQAITQAYQKWDGKDYNDLAHLALQGGATGDAVQGIQQHGLEIKQKYSEIAKDDAATGASNIATRMKTNDIVSGALSTVLQAPDAQLPQALMSTAQQLQQQGLLDAQHVQMAQQIAQSGNPAQIRTQLDLMRKGMLSDTQLLDEAQKGATTRKDNATANLEEAKAAWAKEHGTPLGVSVDEQGLTDYLSKHPGSGASDYVTWKAKQAPLAQLSILNATGNGRPNEDVAKQFGMSPTAFDQTAEKYWTTGTLPPIGRGGGGQAMNKAIMNRAAELHPDGSIAENSAEYKALSESLKKLQSNFDAVSAFENTANKNIEMLKGLASKVPDLGARFANVPVRMLSGSMIGSENMAAFKTALAPVQSEAAKILNSANLSGQLSDSSRHELQELVDGNLPYKSLVASLNVLQQDFKNRSGSISEQLTDIRSRLSGKGADTGQPAVNDIKTFPNGKTGKWDGHGWVAQ